MTYIPNLIPKSIGTAKGDIIGFTASGTPARLAVGADNLVLTASAAAGSGLAWASPTSPLLVVTTIKTGAYTALSTDDVIRTDPTTPFTVTLPATAVVGKKYTIKISVATANATTISAGGVTTIDGSVSYVLSDAGSGRPSVDVVGTAAGTYEII